MAAKKRALICGAGGFIGGHLEKRLKAEGYWVRGVDLRENEFRPTAADDFVVGDLRDPCIVARVIDEGIHEVYQLAADMGGAGFVFVGDNDAAIVHNSALINLNVVEECRRKGVTHIFYSSSACIYPATNQADPDNPHCEESSAYPAQPDSEYGWEKLFSERLYGAYMRNHRLRVHIARLHNVYGPFGSWNDGREKAPAALCRKVAQTPDGGKVDIWGDGRQTRSFLYVDECVEGIRRFMTSRLSRACQYRLRGNGEHQCTVRWDMQRRRQDSADEAYRRTPGSPRAQLRQSPFERAPLLGALHVPASRFGTYLSLDRAAGVPGAAAQTGLKVTLATQRAQNQSDSYRTVDVFAR